VAVDTLQHPWELEELLCVLRDLAPTRVLEIGAWEGGTLRHWLDSELVVVIDDEMRRADDWLGWAENVGCDLRLLKGRSQDPEIVAAARGHGPYDFVFVDADHRYAAGKADWENYSPMVAPGGVIAFHDIRRYEHGDLDRLWDEIKVGRRTLEIHDRTGDAWGGIGLVWM